LGLVTANGFDSQLDEAMAGLQRALDEMKSFDFQGSVSRIVAELLRRVVAGGWDNVRRNNFDETDGNQFFNRRSSGRLLRRLPTQPTDQIEVLLPYVWFANHPEARRKRAA
jgi:hypothetical protein